MIMYDIIEKKKLGQILTKEEINFVVTNYTEGQIPDYQMSTLLMAICLNGMNIEETIELTLAMANSGELLDLAPINGIKVDKHSTGGVGDTTTLIVAPLVAACGVPVAKMSGRGLGHTGGTIDKLEAFSGFNVEIPLEQFMNAVNNNDICVVAQTNNLAPADKKIYALRDVTATVDNLSLIAASIMSKKIASGADAIVLDVKCGNGAFMKTRKEAYELAKVMVDIGNGVGRKTVAIVTNMSQPLGCMVGNSLEVIEAIEALKGNGSKDLMEVSMKLASQMLILGGSVKTEEESMVILQQCIESGRALDKMKQWVKSQGGNVCEIEDTTLLPNAKYSIDVVSNKSGYVGAIDTAMIGKAAFVIGAGRKNKDDIIDLGVGLCIKKRIGDNVNEGDIIATIMYNDEQCLELAKKYVKEAFHISEEQVTVEPLIYDVIM
ncbi:MAG: pyrimidine-nucleoside phosphorylase [Cellulosilyticaceae bacterium]